jgi:hypothetical protein
MVLDHLRDRRHFGRGGWCCYWPENRRWAGGWLILFILIGLLGWRVFEPPIQ